MPKTQIESVRQSPKFESLIEEAQRELAQRRGGALESLGGGPAPAEVADVAEELRMNRESPGSHSRMRGALEAIILEKLRPPYFIVNDKIEIIGDYDHLDVLKANQPALEKVARSVGRLDLVHHPTLDYGGTGWLVDRDIAITNRHVARLFAERQFLGGFDFKRGRFGEWMEARLNYMRQDRTEDDRMRRAEVLEVLYIADDTGPDLAFLRVRADPAVEPLELHTGPVEKGLPVAAIGYPAADPQRNDPTLMGNLFRNVYDVKRFSPGQVTDDEAEDFLVLSDYTTLGGNSGSPVVDLATGKAVALHFAGLFKDANYAVIGNVVAAALMNVKNESVAVAMDFVEAPPSAPESFADRKGYDENFLGTGALRVPHPGRGPWAADIAPVADDADGVLKYHHFSVVQSVSRRLPLYTAVNIDGSQAVSLKRRGDWRTDGRLRREHQVDNVLYRSNPLDRGHMVRRKDPGWGANAQAAEIDTFHYTNCAPQHANLNQRDWVGLEDYILESADTRDFRASVFTGPIFRDDDRRLRTQPGAEDVRIPREFWKIAVMVNDETGELSATGYILSHGEMIRNLTEAAFVLGEYKTYQVQIKRIEQATGLDFGDLCRHDPLGKDLNESFVEAVRPITGPGSLQLKGPAAAAAAVS